MILVAAGFYDGRRLTRSRCPISAFTMPDLGVHDARSRRSRCPISVFTMPDLGVHDAPIWPFTIIRDPHVVLHKWARVAAELHLDGLRLAVEADIAAPSDRS